MSSEKKRKPGRLILLITTIVYQISKLCPRETERSKSQISQVSVCLFIYFWWYWGLNSEPCTCEVDTLLLPTQENIFVIGVGNLL
jgi:hypothetical protein